MLAVLGHADAEVSIVLCGDSEIRELNREYRGKDSPTDVLAFAMREGRGPQPRMGVPEMLGDVVISVQTAERQARAGLLAEVTMLLAHGLLHLLGHDHRTDAEDRRMSARVDLLCEAACRAR